jgi:methylase of polypeptide subunit release factors
VLQKEQRKHLKERNKKAIQETLKEVRLAEENLMENQVKMKIQEGILQEEIKKKPIEHITKSVAIMRRFFYFSKS